MSELTHNRPPLNVRLRDRLYQKMNEVPRTTALLLDVSGSMEGSPIIELRKVADQFKRVRRFAFSDYVREINADQSIGRAEGGTDMTMAFKVLKFESIHHIILVTDGQPNDKDSALQAADGLKIDVFYIGPPPAPDFLMKLTHQTGGKYGEASLEFPKELTDRIRGLLSSPPEKSGPIAL